VETVLLETFPPHSLIKVLSYAIANSAIFTWPWPHNVANGEEDDDSASVELSSEIQVLPVRNRSFIDTFGIYEQRFMSRFARVRYIEGLAGCLLVGIDEPTAAPEYKDDFSDYDWEEAHYDYEGNVLSFGLSVTGGDEFNT
jgi:hypothetical protein